jgi:lipoprotein NlpI
VSVTGTIITPGGLKGQKPAPHQVGECMFLGQMTPAAALAAADDPNANTKMGQVCEANFYSGELALRQNQKEDAVRLFRLAADGCPIDFTEWPVARLELTALGVRP